MVDVFMEGLRIGCRCGGRGEDIKSKKIRSTCRV